MKREFVNKSWIFCIPISALLRIHLSMYGKPGLTREKYCESSSPSYTD
jgi:hypothetical protein